MFDNAMDEELPNEDDVIESVLGENPRAVELQSMIKALETMKGAILREAHRSVSPNERIKLEARLAEIQMQLKTLRDEEAITSFVENSVRITISRPATAHQLTQMEVDDDLEY